MTATNRLGKIVLLYSETNYQKSSIRRDLYVHHSRTDVIHLIQPSPWSYNKNLYCSRR